MVSALTIAELTGGMRSSERREVWLLLASLGVEPVTELVARRAGELMRHYRRDHPGIGFADYVIAATAEVKGLTLATSMSDTSPCSRTSSHVPTRLLTAHVPEGMAALSTHPHE